MSVCMLQNNLYFMSGSFPWTYQPIIQEGGTVAYLHKTIATYTILQILFKAVQLSLVNIDIHLIMVCVVPYSLFILCAQHFELLFY